MLLHNTLFLRHITFFALVFSITFSAFSQQNQVNSGSYFYYGPEGKVYLATSNEKLMVAFSKTKHIGNKNSTKALKTKDKLDVLSSFASKLENYDSTQTIIPGGFEIIAMKGSLSESEVVKLVEDLEKKSDVQFASPVYQTADAAEISLSNKINVRLKESTSIKQFLKILLEHNLKIKNKNEFDSLLYIVEPITKDNSLKISVKLYETGAFEFSEPELIYNLQKHTVDPFFNSQWSLKNTGFEGFGTSGADMNVEQAWNISKGSPNIKIAIIDEGVDLTHPDLIDNLLPGYDATGRGSNGNLIAKKYEIRGSEFQADINLSQYNSGIYIMEIEVDGVKFMKSVMKL